MNGLIAVRSITASISARADWIAPLISSSVTVSRLGRSLMSVRRHDQVAVAVDLGGVVEKLECGGAELIVNGGPAQSLAGQQRLAPVHRDIRAARTVEAHAARIVRPGLRAGGGGNLRQVDLVDEAERAQAQGHDFD